MNTTPPTDPPDNTLWSDADAVEASTVPVYPVIPIEITADGQATVYGRPITVPDGTTPAVAALAAAAAEAALTPGSADIVRVAATDPTGTTWPLAVTADGQVLQLTEPAATQRPPWFWPAIAAAMTIVLAIAGTATVLALRRPAPSQPVATTAPPPLTPVGSGANLPRPAPPGFAGTAAWSVPVHPTIPPVVTADGTVAVVTDDRDIVLLDPTTGQTIWKAKTPRSVTNLHLTQIDGHLCAAVATTTTLTYWPLPERTSTPTPATEETEGIEVTLPRQGRLTWTGASPLIELPDQTAAVITRRSTPRLDIPVGAVPAAAEDQTVLALDDQGHWWHLTPGTTLTPGTALTAPQATSGRPTRIQALDVEHVLAVWPARKGRQIAVLHQLPTGQPRAQLRLPTASNLDTPTLVTQPANTRAALGPLLIDTDGALIHLGATVTAGTVTAEHVYATDTQNRAVDITVTGTKTHASVIPGHDPAIPLGIVTRPDAPPLALVLADKVENRLLYALPGLSAVIPESR